MMLGDNDKLANEVSGEDVQDSEGVDSSGVIVSTSNNGVVEEKEGSDESDAENDSTSTSSSELGIDLTSEEGALLKLLGEKETWEHLVEPECTIGELVERINSGHESTGGEELPFRQAVFVVLDDACKGKDVEDALVLIGRGKQMKKWLFIRMALSPFRVKVPEKGSYVLGLLNFFNSGTVEVYVSNWKTEKKQKQAGIVTAKDSKEDKKGVKSNGAPRGKARAKKDVSMSPDSPGMPLPVDGSAQDIRPPSPTPVMVYGNSAATPSQATPSEAGQFRTFRTRKPSTGESEAKKRKRMPSADLKEKSFKRKIKRLELRVEQLERLVTELTKTHHPTTTNTSTTTASSSSSSSTALNTPQDPPPPITTQSKYNI